jgi:hypothetical protein
MQRVGRVQRTARPPEGLANWLTSERMIPTMSSEESELLAQQVSALNEKVSGLERRMADVEQVNARLEQAALITARALEEIGALGRGLRGDAPRGDGRCGRRTHRRHTTWQAVKAVPGAR